MKKIAAFTLLAVLTLGVAAPAFARTHRNAEARAADRRAKALRKAMRQQAKSQQKAMKQAQKDQLRNAR